MGKKAPSAVSSDDRLKASVLVLLKQQASAEEVGRDVLGSGAIKIGEKDEDASPTEGSKAGPVKDGGLVGRKTYGAATSAAKLPGSTAKKIGSAAKGTAGLAGSAAQSGAGLIGGAAKKIGSAAQSGAGAVGVGPKATVNIEGVTGGRAPVKGKTDSGATPSSGLSEPPKI